MGVDEARVPNNSEPSMGLVYLPVPTLGGLKMGVNDSNGASSIPVSWWDLDMSGFAGCTPL